MCSSIQTIVLKHDSDISNITDTVLKTLGNKCYLDLHHIKKGKEAIASIRKHLNTTLPSVQGDKVIQIGTVCYRYGLEKTTMTRHIVTLGGCDALPGIDVVSCTTVQELIRKWVLFMIKEQPNVITGYNIFGFDFKFLWECAEEYDCLHYLKTLGPLKNVDAQLKEKELFSACNGSKFSVLL